MTSTQETIRKDEIATPFAKTTDHMNMHIRLSRIDFIIQRNQNNDQSGKMQSTLPASVRKLVSCINQSKGQFLKTGEGISRRDEPQLTEIHINQFMTHMTDKDQSNSPIKLHRIVANQTRFTYLPIP